MTKPKLSPSSLYSGDNGRIFCGALACAGHTAHTTGRDLSGQRVHKIDAEYLNQARDLGFVPECEGCGKGPA